MPIGNLIRIAILSLGCAGATTAAADHVTAPVSEVGIEIRFTPDEIRLIRAYYADGTRDNERGGRGGKGNHSGLPPGIAKNLGRGKALPPGIAKRYLPGDLTRVLPPVQNGYERIVVDGKILLVEIATRVVRDILYDVVL